MSPERIAGPQVRAVNSYNRAPQSVAVLLAICCCLSAAGGQTLEKTIALSDSLGDIWPNAVYFVPSGNCVYVAGDDGVMVVDATTNARVARIDMDEPMFMAIDSRDNKVYIGEEDSLAVIDPVTHSVVSRIWVGGSPYRICYNPKETSTGIQRKFRDDRRRVYSDYHGCVRRRCALCTHRIV